MTTTATTLLTAALEYHARGLVVIPVDREKRALCQWGHWRERAQTESEVHALPWEWAYGVAILTWPAGDFVVIDFDGPHANAAWKTTGISLLRTAVNRTRSGGLHAIYRVPPGTPQPGGENDTGLRRKVRLVVAHGCGCAKVCGVDLLLNGYFVAPPTPGYQEHPDHPFELSNLAVISQAVLELARAADRDNGDFPRRAEALAERFPAGQRNASLTSLAGTMRRRGMSEPAIVAALQEENVRRCDPPLALHEVQAIAASVSRYEPATERGAILVENLTDVGNARRLVALYGDRFRWCEKWGCFEVWDGTRWARDDGGQVMRWGKDTAKAMYAEAADTADEAQRKALVTHALRSESESRLRGMVNLAKSEESIPITPDAFDRDSWLLNVANGTLGLRTGELRPHRREDLLTKLIPVAYDPEATAPTFDAFLSRIMGEDVEMITFLQRAAGYSLTGSTREQCWLLCYGRGSNGKTTLFRTLTDLLADYAAWTPSQTLLARRGERIENDLARLELRERRRVAAPERGEKRLRGNLGLLRDPVQIRGDRVARKARRGRGRSTTRSLAGRHLPGGVAVLFADDVGDALLGHETSS
jgi:hypothetical protein